MAQGLPGADSTSPVTTSMIQSATSLLGATPAFWGRYFTSPSAPGSAEYQPTKENNVLYDAGIRLLPIAYQPNNVNGSFEQGLKDAVENSLDFSLSLDSYLDKPLSGKLYMFLEVTGSPSLSSDYYSGWSGGLYQGSGPSQIELVPCVYALQSDSTTWTAASQGDGASCSGALIANHNTGNCAMGEWNDAAVTPSVALPFPIFAWQYAGNCLNGAINCSQTNPNIDVKSQLLQFLLLPPLL
jgi:hypothetical protein